MIRFECDYAEGAHERVLRRLFETNLEQTPGYGEDEYCEGARGYLRALCKDETVDVHFLVGGTQTNATVISAALRPHQGVIAVAAVREYASVEDILQAARDKGEAPLLVVCDELSDPHNLGAVIRTAECAGAHGVVIPKRRSAGLTAVVAKTSAGAVSHLPVARVANLPSLLKQLKKEGLWIFGSAADGPTSLYEADLKGPAALVIGSEGEGMSRLVAETCDFLVSIPMKGKLNSLNASAAAAILLYEALRQRL